MTDRLKAMVLRWARVPADPEPPPGDPSTVRVFRAAPGYFRYKLIGWAFAQLGTLVGLVLGLVLLGFIGERVGDWFGGWAGVAIAAGELFAWVVFLSQIPLGLAALRLDYELRWYMLTDRSLRIREGILRVREKTMTFANIQQISVRQGPIQRLLGLADVEVRTAGGGSTGEGEGSDDLHRGFFRGVADAESIRDAIRTRVQEYRAQEADDARVDATGVAAAARPGAEVGRVGDPARPVAAARMLLDEVRALRAVLSPGTGGA